MSIINVGDSMLTWLRESVNVLVALYVGGVTGALGVIALGSARVGWPAFLREIESLLFIPLPCLLLTAVALRARFAMLALMAPLTALMVLCWPWFAAPTPALASGPQLRVMSFNVGAARGMTRPASVLRTIHVSSPDVVCLVEGPSNAGTTIGAELRDTHPYQVNSASVFLFSRFPLTEIRTAVVPTGAKDSLQVTLEIDHRLISLTAVHIQRADAFPRLANGPISLMRTVHTFSTDARDAAISEVARLIQREGGASILVGDFNMTPSSLAYRRLSAELQDAFHDVGWGLGYTYPTGLRPFGLTVAMPLVRIDYIFHSRALVARQAWVGADGDSDHLPVIADLSFR